ncbi:MAG TPA: PEP-CTERM sorting domain-containing protein [Verrucomicrobiae bacterium]|nr:PEP-CTERM sorting domain-containing protein [Verrucomicrobiae bacterium]
MNQNPIQTKTSVSRRSSACLITSALALIAAGHSVSGAALSGSMSESFDYGAGTQVPNASTLNGGTGWNLNGDGGANAAGANWGAANNGGAPEWRTVTSPGLTYNTIGYVNGGGNKLTLDASGNNVNQNVGRNFGGQTIDSGTTYFSLLMAKNIDSLRTINFAFFNGTTERFAVGQIGAAAGNSGGNIALLMNNQNPAGLIQNATSPVAMGVDVTHLLIGRIDWNPDGFETVSLWVDPANVTSEGAAGAAYLSTSGFELTALTGIRPFVGNLGGGFPAVSADFDEIRLGTTWAAVVPEPATGTLLGLGALALAFRRKNVR